MKTYALALGALSLTLGGCLGAPEPVVLPDDDIAAARTCFVAQGLVLRDGRSESDPITFDEFASSMKYALVAAANTEPFSTEKVSEVFTGTDPVADEISGMDYEGAIATCDARFGIDTSVNLPDEDKDAVLSCLSLAAFMQGAAQSQVADFGADGNTVGPLFERLQARMTSDPDILVAMIGGDVEAMMMDATKSAFAEGAPREYIDACAARFPAEG